MNSMRNRILDWMSTQKDWFNYKMMDQALDITTPKDKTLRRVVIFGLKKHGFISKHPYRRSTFKNNHLYDSRISLES